MIWSESTMAECPKCGGVDIAMILYGLPSDELLNSKKVKKEFLSLWKDYKNNKIEKEKFLQISDEFARVLYEEKQMRKRFGKIIGPLHKKYEKICGLLDDLERVNNG